MVYATEEATSNANYTEVPMILDPKLLRMARRIYRAYCVLHPKTNRRPLGIAIHRDTHRGQLMFNNKPILLPGECFVPVKQLESSENR
ncbi:MAG: hypothetical protein VKJ02_14350 [Snowella sp.]|nr:hypothetical protein [Snowella sp.]